MAPSDDTDDTLPPGIQAFERRQAARERRELVPGPVVPMAMAAAERVLGKYGLATLLALAFFWWVTSDVSGTMRDIRATLDGHVNETTFFLRQVCVNTAQTEAQRAGCVAPPVTKVH